MTPVEHPSCADPCQIGIARPTRHTPAAWPRQPPRAPAGPAGGSAGHFESSLESGASPLQLAKSRRLVECHVCHCQ